MIPKIYVLIGPPACGKSTLARKMHAEDNSKVIVSPDSIRSARGNYWIPDQEDYISTIEEFEIKSAIEKGLSPIIDATNLNPKTIEKWEQLSVELDVDLQKIYLPYVPFPEALERDKKRGEEGGRAVGEKVLRQFYMKYYPDQYYKDINSKCKSTNPDDSLPPAIIFDLDQTIMFAQNRGPFEYAKAGSDYFDPKAKWLIERWIADGITPIFLTGREISDESVAAINKALNLPKIHKMDGDSDGYIIIGRKVGDRRKGLIVKEELYTNNVEGKFNVLAAFDDHQDVVDMYREKGIFACKVN